MDIEKLRRLCLQLPGVTEDIKWEKDLCFPIGGKMFCLTGLDQAFSASFKTTEEAYGNLTGLAGIIPAPYLARYHWVLVEEAGRLTTDEWEQYIRQAYQLVRDKLPVKTKKQLGLLL